MHSLAQLQKQQVGIRLPKFLVEKLDEFSKRYNLNRTDIIIESISSYLSEQEEREFYKSFDRSCKELKKVLKDPKSRKYDTIEELLDEL